MMKRSVDGSQKQIADYRKSVRDQKRREAKKFAHGVATAFREVAPLIIAPRLDEASLTRAHVALTAVEREMRLARRGECADAISYADLVILVIRNRLAKGRLPW